MIQTTMNTGTAVQYVATQQIISEMVFVLNAGTRSRLATKTMSRYSRTRAIDHLPRTAYKEIWPRCGRGQ